MKWLGINLPLTIPKLVILTGWANPYRMGATKQGLREMIIGKPFKLEYKCGDIWEIAAYCGSIIILHTEIIKWRSRGYTVRCINQIGEDLAKGY